VRRKALSERRRNMSSKSRFLRTLFGALLAVVTLLAGTARGVLGMCGPFTDVAADAFCPFVLEIFYLGITSGTTATTYDPTSNVTRLQMAAFLSRTVDRTLLRSSRRAALQQFWTPGGALAVNVTTLGGDPQFVVSDGADLWATNVGASSIQRVRASDGKLLESWTGAPFPVGVISAMGRIFAGGQTTPSRIYEIDPSQAAGAVTTVASNLGTGIYGITFDGSRIWAANIASSVSIVTPGPTIPWTVTTVTAGFANPQFALYDGTNVWVADDGSRSILRLDSGGAILQTVTVGLSPGSLVFDGENLWVPSFDQNSLSVVRASSGAVLATLTGNGLNQPFATAFDGQRVLVTNQGGMSVSLWKAADLSPLESVPLGETPRGACSNGVNFWIVLMSSSQLARF
jgi:hypothetical protein